MKLHVFLALAALVVGFTVPTLAQQKDTITDPHRNASTEVSFNRHAGAVPQAKRTLFSVSCSHPVLV